MWVLSRKINLGNHCDCICHFFQVRENNLVLFFLDMKNLIRVWKHPAINFLMYKAIKKGSNSPKLYNIEADHSCF